ncbi:glycoside hydrolase domain-containing protein [Nocardioides sp. LHG3406-4]|uniref:glycoside hydrolase domain-containing protein n=1 Tax=Nocardioides sp. LHG3406-4 TaxID=2804575 RepID=UPI003CE746E7
MHALTRLAALTAATCLTIAGLAAPSGADPSAPQPARADTWVRTPGPFTGYGFDVCAAPDQATMDAWRTSSPFAAVGIYTGGTNRLCEQPNLTADWVRTQVAAGWHLMPIHVGPQAACTTYESVMASDRPTAEAQGRLEAAAAVSSVQALAIGTGSTIYYDLEDYDITDQACRQAALSFLSGWTQQLHAQGYRSGVYSNIAAAITSLDLANNVSRGSYAMPDDIWFAWGNGVADTEASTWVATSEWDDHERAHQYLLDVEQTYGGVTQTIDLNWVDVGGGSTAPKDTKGCRGVQVDQRKYPSLRPGSRSKHVEALQCLLREQHFGKPATSGRYDDRTARAVRKAQRKLGLRVTGKVTRKTWTALHARGTQPLLKVGSTGEPVRRLQRALTATLGKAVRIDGVMSVRTRAAVSRFQQREHLAPTGNVDIVTWERLASGG